MPNLGQKCSFGRETAANIMYYAMGDPGHSYVGSGKDHDIAMQARQLSWLLPLSGVSDWNGGRE